MRGCAWLTGIDRHVLNASVCEQAGVGCKALFKVEPSRSRRLYLSTLAKIFRLKDSLQHCNIDDSVLSGLLGSSIVVESQAPGR
jgi:hypothetical protein